MRARHFSGFLGILGWPLNHTLSPAIQNAALRKAGIDWVYLAWPTPPEVLSDAIVGLRALGCLGANITMPHKEAVIEHLDVVSGDARAVGAVNTIQRVGDRLIGHNTDVDGFREFMLADAGADVAGKTALVLGSGGAARAVVKALDDLGTSAITIAARTPERGENLISLAPRGNASVIGWSEAETRAGEFDVIVNTTPLGSEGADPIPEGRLHSGQLVVDLIYEPPTTKLVERARAAGAEAWGGLGMLVHQAAWSFRIWTGQHPSVETMSAAALHSVLRR